jgi:hypothetical protein
VGQAGGQGVLVGYEQGLQLRLATHALLVRVVDQLCWRNLGSDLREGVQHLLPHGNFPREKLLVD